MQQVEAGMIEYMPFSVDVKLHRATDRCHPTVLFTDRTAQQVTLDGECDLGDLWLWQDPTDMACERIDECDQVGARPAKTRAGCYR